MNHLGYEQLQEAVHFIQTHIGSLQPKIGLILGSGLGSFADQLTNSIAIEYKDIPHFPLPHVSGHAGRFVVGHVEEVCCVAMQGRVHFYEGYDIESVVFPTRTLILLGAKTLLLTNAAGGICNDWSPGTLMLISDHINLIPQNPLRGPNEDRLGPRFPDMTQAYAPELRKLAKQAAKKLGIPLPEGTYAAMPGPTYETPAEVDMLRALGADATGMSTVPETIVANHMGAKVLGISCITNKAATTLGPPLSHDEVTATANKVRTSFTKLLRSIIPQL